MLVSIGTYLKMTTPFKPSQLSLQSFDLKPYKNPLCFLNPKPSICSLHTQKSQTTKRLKLSMSATETISPQEETPTHKKKLGVVVKPMEKPRVVLKFIWMEKIIGIALNQVIPGYGTIPLSPYYFWPKEDAWEKLMALLESKPWISRRQMFMLLNQATDIITLWQESGGKLK